MFDGAAQQVTTCRGVDEWRKLRWPSRTAGSQGGQQRNRDLLGDVISHLKEQGLDGVKMMVANT